MARSRGRGTRLNKVWTTSGIVDGAALTTTQSNPGSIGVSLAENVQDGTILRIRGGGLVRATPDAATDSDMVGMGLIVVNQAASAVGGTSLPGPINDAGADWLWYSNVFLDAAGATGETATNLSCTRYFEIDSKAMRHIRADQFLAFMAELSTGDFADVGMFCQFRTLIGF